MAKLLATLACAVALSPSFVERSPPPASALPPARPFDWSGGAEPATTGADAAAWPAVSVTVITRARPAFLAHALANLAAQDYPRSRLEVLVVDDTPGRAGPAAWDALRRAAPAAVSELGGCLRYLHGGGRRARLGAKRNAAVGAARGELVVVADDDDYYAPSRLRAQAVPLARGDADVVLLSAERAGLQREIDRIGRAAQEAEAREDAQFDIGRARRRRNVRRIEFDRAFGNLEVVLGHGLTRPIPKAAPSPRQGPHRTAAPVPRVPLRRAATDRTGAQ